MVLVSGLLGCKKLGNAHNILTSYIFQSYSFVYHLPRMEDKMKSITQIVIAFSAIALLFLPGIAAASGINWGYVKTQYSLSSQPVVHNRDIFELPPEVTAFEVTYWTGPGGEVDHIEIVDDENEMLTIWGEIPEDTPVELSLEDPIYITPVELSLGFVSIRLLGTEGLFVFDGGDRSDTYPTNLSCLRLCWNDPDQAACLDRCNKGNG